MSNVFCFGELLLRFSPELNGAWIRQSSMPVFVGGAELNVATALTRWNVPVSYGTALPENYLSKEIISALQQNGIDTSKIVFCGKRIGTYYLPQGTDLKHAGVIYDRAHSAFCDLQPGQLDWDEILDGVHWFHFSAISAAINANLALVCKEAVLAASKKGITVSVDLNYRAKLWQYGKQPQEVMPELVQYCNVIMGNLWAAEMMLGVPVAKELAHNQDAYVEHSLRTSEEICKLVSRCQQVAHTFRFDVNDGVHYYATLYTQDQMFVSREHSTPFIVDKVGSGDTFMAGLIYGSNNALKAQEIIEFAAAAAFNKLFIKGDATNASVEEIKKGYLHYE